MDYERTQMGELFFAIGQVKCGGLFGITKEEKSILFLSISKDKDAKVHPLNKLIPMGDIL
jgi:hypothetical protein